MGHRPIQVDRRDIVHSQAGALRCKGFRQAAAGAFAGASDQNHFPGEISHTASYRAGSRETITSRSLTFVSDTPAMMPPIKAECGQGISMGPLYPRLTCRTSVVIGKHITHLLLVFSLYFLYTV